MRMSGLKNSDHKVLSTYRDPREKDALDFCVINCLT